jgi:hypothetical protein
MSTSPRLDYCLVSDQSAPNLLPYFDPNFRPSGVVLVVSPEKKESVAPLQSVLSEATSVEILHVPSAFDVPSIAQRIRDHAQAARARGFETWLNLTGGTKPMAIAAYIAFGDGRIGRSYYLNASTNRLMWFGAGETEPDVRLDARVDLRLFLAAKGYTIAAAADEALDPRHVAYAERVGADVGKLATEIRLLNTMIDAVAKRRLGHPVPNGLPTDHRSGPRCVLDHAVDCDLGAWDEGVFRPSGTPDQVEATWRLLRSTWLDLHVASVVRRLPGIPVQDVATRVTIRDQAGNTDSLDVAAFIDDTFVAVECRTGAYPPKASLPRDANKAVRLLSSAADQLIYKLIRVQQEVGGFRSASVIVSMDEATPLQRARTNESRITLIAGAAEIADLASHLAKSLKRLA